MVTVFERQQFNLLQGFKDTQSDESLARFCVHKRLQSFSSQDCLTAPDSGLIKRISTLASSCFLAIYRIYERYKFKRKWRAAQAEGKGYHFLIESLKVDTRAELKRVRAEWELAPSLEEKTAQIKAFKAHFRAQALSRLAAKGLRVEPGKQLSSVEAKEHFFHYFQHLKGLPCFEGEYRDYYIRSLNLESQECEDFSLDELIGLFIVESKRALEKREALARYTSQSCVEALEKAERRGLTERLAAGGSLEESAKNTGEALSKQVENSFSLLNYFRRVKKPLSADLEELKKRISKSPTGPLSAEIKTLFKAVPKEERLAIRSAYRDMPFVTERYEQINQTYGFGSLFLERSFASGEVALYEKGVKKAVKQFWRDYKEEPTQKRLEIALQAQTLLEALSRRDRPDALKAFDAMRSHTLALNQLIEQVRYMFKREESCERLGQIITEIQSANSKIIKNSSMR